MTRLLNEEIRILLAIANDYEVGTILEKGNDGFKIRRQGNG